MQIRLPRVLRTLLVLTTGAVVILGVAYVYRVRYPQATQLVQTSDTIQPFIPADHILPSTIISTDALRGYVNNIRLGKSHEATEDEESAAWAIRQKENQAFLEQERAARRTWGQAHFMMQPVPHLDELRLFVVAPALETQGGSGSHGGTTKRYATIKIKFWTTEQQFCRIIPDIWEADNVWRFCNTATGAQDGWELVMVERLPGPLKLLRTDTSNSTAAQLALQYAVYSHERVQLRLRIYDMSSPLSTLQQSAQIKSVMTDDGQVIVSTQGTRWSYPCALDEPSPKFANSQHKQPRSALFYASDEFQRCSHNGQYVTFRDFAFPGTSKIRELELRGRQLVYSREHDTVRFRSITIPASCHPATCLTELESREAMFGAVKPLVDIGKPGYQFTEQRPGARVRANMAILPSSFSNHTSDANETASKPRIKRVPTPETLHDAVITDVIVNSQGSTMAAITLGNDILVFNREPDPPENADIFDNRHRAHGDDWPSNISGTRTVVSRFAEDQNGHPKTIDGSETFDNERRWRTSHVFNLNKWTSSGFDGLASPFHVTASYGTPFSDYGTHHTHSSHYRGGPFQHSQQDTVLAVAIADIPLNALSNAEPGYKPTRPVVIAMYDDGTLASWDVDQFAEPVVWRTFMAERWLTVVLMSGIIIWFASNEFRLKDLQQPRTQEPAIQRQPAQSNTQSTGGVTQPVQNDNT
ncbi:hypothetical protein GQ42DRAFT_156624 [Ramicandelaber brevisporus]|nr:hypothetical protein GQ42DRAFT_156624 [Ramicandelaber brevisporus]